MKLEKCNNKISMAFFLLCFASLLVGCGTKSSETAAPSVIPTATPIIVSTATPTVVPTLTPTTTPTLTPTMLADGIVRVNIGKDIDKNGVEDRIQIRRFNDDTETCMDIFLNGEKILEYQDPNVRFVGVNAFEYVDLDEDEINEILVCVGTDSNSREFVNVFCLKQMDGQWKFMDTPRNEQGNNGFDYRITRGKEEMEFIIAPKLTKQQIHLDASSFFIDDELGNIDSIQAYRKNNYKEGDELDYSLGWGIAAAKTGTFQGRNCIIATEGFEVPYGNGIGDIITYYAYKEGKIEILHVEFQTY